MELLRPATPTNRGFWLGQPFWGLGYMTEALTPVTDYAFNGLGFQKLIFGNASGNERSRRVKEKAGAKMIHLEPAQYVDPAFVFRETWELSKEEWVMSQQCG